LFFFLLQHWIRHVLVLAFHFRLIRGLFIVLILLKVRQVTEMSRFIYTKKKTVRATMGIGGTGKSLEVTLNWKICFHLIPRFFRIGNFIFLSKTGYAWTRGGKD
jgi:hypothetical protein